MNNEQLSMLEVAIKLLEEKGEPTLITQLIAEVLNQMGIEDPDNDNATQLYMDITASSSFVFCGEGLWDLKANQSLELFDRDGSSFNTGVEAEEEADDVELSDYDTDDDDVIKGDDEEDDDDDDDEEEEYDDMSYDEVDPTDDDDDEMDYLDEEKYNDIMDDYEDMYEDE